MATEHAPIAPRTVKHVIGPSGRHLTLADLSSADTKRWVIRRKAEVVAAVRGGLLSLEEACDHYALSADEILSWQHRIDHFGLAGLRTTRSQLYLPLIKARHALAEAGWRMSALRSGADMVLRPPFTRSGRADDAGESSARSRR